MKTESSYVARAVPARPDVSTDSVQPRLGNGAGAPRRARRMPPARVLVTATALILISFVAQPLAHAQGTGVVEGRLVDKSDPSIIGAKVDLDVIGFAGGMSILKSATTDSTGKFRIDGLPTDQMLMIRANYKGANYHGQVSFDAAGKAYVEIEIFEPTDSTREIRVEGVRMAFQLVGDRLQSLQTVSFDNQTRPPKTYMNKEGNFRFSKAPGILELPKVDVSGPGAVMPLSQSPLESPDGLSYYSLYPLRPGITTFEIQEVLPYSSRTYTYRKKFYQDVSSFQIGVIPADMVVMGEGLTRVQVDGQRNFAVYSGGPVKAGTEVAWTFSGGTPVTQAAPAAGSGESTVKPAPTFVGQNALVIGPLLLMGFVVVLWYAYNNLQTASQSGDARTRELKERREQLLNSLANLDNRYESQTLDRREYVRLREQGKRQLRRIFLLLKK
jgi:hypothetical protein